MHPIRLHRHPLALAALAAGAVLLPACGGSSSSSSSSSTPSAPSTSGTSSGAGAKTIKVSEGGFFIRVAGASSVPAGTYTFAVTSSGSHNLTINGPGVSNKATPTFSGGPQHLTVTLKAGTYDLYCSIPGHKQAGMDTKLTVT
jgi:plastocyanin